MKKGEEPDTGQEANQEHIYPGLRAPASFVRPPNPHTRYPPLGTMGVTEH